MGRAYDDGVAIGPHLVLREVPWADGTRKTPIYHVEARRTGDKLGEVR